MNELIAIHVRPPVHEKLQRLAILSGDESAAIERLIEHWERSTLAATAVASPKADPDRPLWRSAAGDELPVGQLLEGPYLGQTFKAGVERNGIRLNGSLYLSLTAAAQAAKLTLGRKGKSASTNGREFWKVRDPATSRLVPVSALRPITSVDVDKLFAELEAL